MKGTDRFYFAGEAIPEMQVGALAVNCEKLAVNIALTRSWKFYCPTWNIPAGEQPTLALEQEMIDLKLLVGPCETTVRLPVWYLHPTAEALREHKGQNVWPLIRPFFPSEEKAEKASMRKPKERVTSDEAFKLYAWTLAGFQPDAEDEEPGSASGKRGGKKKAEPETPAAEEENDPFAHMRNCTY